MADPADRLTIEQQLGQTFVAGFWGTTPSADILDLIRRRHVGSVILFSRNLRSAAQTLELTSALQDAARAAGHPAPLLIMTDQENGLVRRLGPDATRFPGNMALGAAGSERLARDVAAATGRELAALGVNMNLAPVVDVNNNPDNPVIGVRSFGEDPRLVASLGAAAVEGYAAAGVVATLKHFPGHGATTTDSHLALPVIPATPDRLGRLELVPFVRGIAAGAACVLIAHVALPALTPSGDDPLPASLSPAVVHGLLRERLGFGGVAVTDCLEMDAVSAGVGVARGAVLALQAGNDLVMVSHRIDRQTPALDAMLAAARSGEIPAGRLREAAGRVLRLKRHLAWDRLPDARGLEVVGSAEHRRLAAEAYAASATLIRDRDGLLPLRLDPAARLLVIRVPSRAITQAADDPFASDTLLDAVCRYHPGAEAALLSPGTSPAEAEDAVRRASEADAVLLVTVDVSRDPERRALAQRIAAAAPRVVGIAAGVPYDAAAVPAGAYLAAYEYTPPALEATLAVVFGRATAPGRLPVTLA